MAHSVLLRQHIVMTLHGVIQERQSLATLLPQQLAVIKDPRDQAFFHHACYGVLRHYAELTHIVDALLAKPITKKDFDLYCVLLLGIYQLRHMRVADHAAISETVNVVKALRKNWAVKLVNAILRTYQRRSTQWDSLNLMPQHWLWQKIKQQWPKQITDIIQAVRQTPPLCLRINTQKIGIADFHRLYHQAGVDFTVPDQLAVIVKTDRSVDKLPGYEEGYFVVQDLAAQQAVPLLPLAEGERVLDACCAPGGKLSHLLQQQPDLARCVGVDLSATRMERVVENCQRLQIQPELITADLIGDMAWSEQSFDHILLDAPCSASGVIKRHPDVPFLRTKSDIAQLSALQGQLLRKLWPLLGAGYLLYVTCSVLAAENDQVVAAFCDDENNVRVEPIEIDWGVACEYGRQLLPSETHDGLYFALLKKG